MDELVDFLVEGTGNSKTSQEICSCLFKFGKEINDSMLDSSLQSLMQDSNPNKTLLRNPLELIWNSLLKCSAHSSSSIRVSTYKATWNFLIKLMPFHPYTMRIAFSELANKCSLNNNNSLLMISSFAFISHFISSIHMENFLARTPIFHHFIQKECLTSEHLFNIISNLSSHIRDDWFKNLLLAFTMLIKNESSAVPNRLIMKAILALIQKNPKLLLPEILVHDLSNVYSGQLSLIAFITSALFSNQNTNSDYQYIEYDSKNEGQCDLNEFDLSNSAIAAFETLKNYSTLSMAEIDDCLSILSLQTNSFKVTVSEIEKNKYQINLNDSNTLIFDDVKSLGRPSFYQLPLPINLLIPQLDNPPTIICAKLKTIGHLFSNENEIQDVDNIIDLLEELCSSDKYNDTMSSCMRCLSLCVNSLILNTKHHKLSRLLRQLLFAKPLSWFHAFDILRVIQSIRYDLITVVLGKSGFRDIIKTVVSFCMNQNSTLSKTSFEAIVKLTTNETFNEITQIVATDIDFYNSFSLQKHLLILSGLIPLYYYNDRSHLFWLFDAVLESIDYHTYDIDAMAAIYRFFSFFKGKLKQLQKDKSKTLIKIAKIIFYSTIELLRNTSNPETLNEQNLLLYHQNSLLSSYALNKEIIKANFLQIVKSFLSKNSVEIVSESSYDFKTHFIHTYSVLNFLLSLPSSLLPSRKLLKIIILSFRMFPSECSNVLRHILPFYDNSQIASITKFSLLYIFQAVPDINVHALWCEIALQPIKFETDEFQFYWINFLKTIFGNATYYAKFGSPHEFTARNAQQFCLFIGFISSNAKFLSIDIDSLVKDVTSVVKHKIIINPYLEYIQLIIDKLSDMKKIQFLHEIEKNEKFTVFFPEIVFELKHKFVYIDNQNYINDAIKHFDKLIAQQKSFLLTSILRKIKKSSPNNLPLQLPNVIIEYSSNNLTGWNKIFFIKNVISINSNTPNSSISLDDIEPRSFNSIHLQPQIVNDIQKRLQLYSNSNSFIEIKTLLSLYKQEYINNPTIIDFTKLSYSSKMIPTIAKFIKSSFSKSEFSQNIISKLMIEMPLITYFFYPEMEFQNQDKMTKEFIIHLCKFMQEFTMTIKGIDNQIINDLTKTNSTKRIQALLTLATVHETMAILEEHNALELDGFNHTVFDILRSKNEELIPQRELLLFAIAVHHFHLHSKHSTDQSQFQTNTTTPHLDGQNFNSTANSNELSSGQHNCFSLEKNIDFIDKFCNLYVFRDIMTLHLDTKPIIKYDDSLMDIVLNSDHPSFILQSIRAMRSLIAVGDTSSILLHFDQILPVFHNFSSIYPMASYISSFYVDILKQSNSSFEIHTINKHLHRSIDFLISGDHLDHQNDIVNSSKRESNNSLKKPQNSNEVSLSETKRTNSTLNLLTNVASNVASAALNASYNALYSSVRSSLITNLFSLVLVPIRLASFSYLATVVIAIIETETNPKEKYYPKLINECQKIVDDGITSFQLCKLYLSILQSRINKVDKKGEMVKEYLVELISSFKYGVNCHIGAKPVWTFFSNSNKSCRLSTFDSYYIQQYLESFLNLLSDYLPAYQVGQFFCVNIWPTIPRFFPSFVVFVKYLKKNKFDPQITKSYLDVSKKYLSEKQIAAINLALKGSFDTEILALSEGTICLK